tara:strand:+ start:6064 stop:6882 length:819 start_codon:yes stop_codon:yes gene_type:complete
LSTYAVGDIQGCLEPLISLLEEVSFDPDKDFLWSVGDIVNRGPSSLETLRFCYKLGSSFRMVLGNHDLHLLATAYGSRKISSDDTFQEILDAPDKKELLYWLQQQPILINEKDYILVHAGIPPQWSLEKAMQLAEELSAVLRCDTKSGEFFNAMYGDQPNIWDDKLTGGRRWRVIANYFTRMRFCTSLGQLHLASKNTTEIPPEGFLPWFQHEKELPKNAKIIFGHWAGLEGRIEKENIFPLDTGYVWGGRMRLMDIDTKEFFHRNHTSVKL